MNEIIIYSKDYCPYCERAKRLLTEFSCTYREILVVNDELKEEMVQKSFGRKTFPQIFIENHHVGGFDDLVKLGAAGVKKLLNN